MRPTTLFFIAVMIDHGKWRCSYGRQCYEAKFRKAALSLPVKADGGLDEDAMAQFVEGASFWPELKGILP